MVAARVKRDRVSRTALCAACAAAWLTACAASAAGDEVAEDGACAVEEAS